MSAAAKMPILAVTLSLSLPSGAAVQGSGAVPVPRTYATACAPCHANNGFGVQALAKRLGKGQSILAARTDLDPALIRLAVRHGIGAMPPMSRAEVSDRELEAIVATLTAKKP